MTLLVEKKYEWASRGQIPVTYGKNWTFELNSLYAIFFFYINKDFYIIFMIPYNTENIQLCT